MSVDAAALAQLARMLGLAIPQDALERLAPSVAKMYADLERLRELPIDERVPALPPLVPAQDTAGRPREDGETAR